MGDESFQKKCRDKIKAVSRDGRTVLFVSHNLKAITDLCGRVLLIRSGKLYEGADPQSTIAKYLDEVAAAEARQAGPAARALV